MKLSRKTTFPASLIILKIIALPCALLSAAAVRADDSSGFFAGINDNFSRWFDRVDAALAEQPHWAPPVATTSLRLQEVPRYDIVVQSLKGGHQLVNYGSGKGLEFIPAERIQFIVGIPPYETENASPAKNGWGDQSFLMNYRFAAANEDEGNYY